MSATSHKAVRNTSIFEAYMSGVKKADLAREHGITITRVTGVLQSENAKRRGAKRLAYKQKAEVIEQIRGENTPRHWTPIWTPKMQAAEFAETQGEG